LTDLQRENENLIQRIKNGNGNCVTLPQIQNENAILEQRIVSRFPASSGGLTLVDLQRELARLPSGSSGSLTLQDLQRELNNRKCINANDLAREFTLFATQMQPQIPVPPAVVPPQSYTPNIRRRSPRSERFPTYNHRRIEESLKPGSSFTTALEKVVSDGGFQTEEILGRTFIRGGSVNYQYAASTYTYNGAMLLDMLEQIGVVAEVDHHKWRHSEINDNIIKAAKFLSTCFIVQTVPQPPTY